MCYGEEAPIITPAEIRKTVVHPHRKKFLIPENRFIRLDLDTEAAADAHPEPKESSLDRIAGGRRPGKALEANRSDQQEKRI